MKRIVFIHILKCAGTSLTSAINDALPQDTRRFICGHHGVLSEFNALSNEDRNAISFFAGHQSWGIQHRFRGESNVITFLRDPIERVWSHYHFIRSRPLHRWYEDAMRLPFAYFVEYMRNRDTVENHDNLITRFLSGIDDGRAVHASDAITAIEHAKAMRFVGFVESMDTDLHACLEALGLPATTVVPFMNSNKKKPAIEAMSTGDLESAIMATRYDSLVYSELRKRRAL